MRDKPDDTPTIGERMNRALGLDPGFTLDHPSLVDAVREDTDSTVKRAQHNVDQQRQNAADIERIAKEMEREAQHETAGEAVSEED
jgi:hypothetical protein